MSRNVANKEVMRFSGPRMLWYYPVMAVHHVISSKREKRKLESGEKNIERSIV